MYIPAGGSRQFGFLLFFLTVLCKNLVFSRICQSINVYNDVKQMEDKLRGCTEIHGNLKIVLIETTKSYSDFDNYVFPELTKISGFLLFFRVQYLQSIGKIFPNLRVIRGVNLFEQVALTVYEMPHLETLSLSKLQYIARGGVTIANNPLLCLADTIDWKGIGAEFARVELTQKRCPPCPSGCDGHCWDSVNCQKADNGSCHMECLGCHKPGSPTDCIVCKNYENNGTCVSACPEYRYVNRSSYACLSEPECAEKNHFVFRDACIDDCPPKYQLKTDSMGRRECQFCDESCFKRCNTNKAIESLHDLEKLEGCTHIDGNLTIQIKEDMDPDLLNHKLSESLGLVRYIRDVLVIGRNNFIKDLKFLENLTVIEGQNASEWNNNRSLFIYENQNLQKLWDFDRRNYSLKITTGNFAFHNNPYLCMSEIEKLGNITGIRYNATDVNPDSNGERASNCDGEEDQITTAVVEVSKKSATLAWKRNKTDDVIYYVIYYTGHAAPFQQTDSQDVCQSGTWRSMVVPATQSNAKLTNLIPYHTYRYYIKTYVRRQPNDTMFKILNTKTYNFTTKQDDPDPPRNFQVIAVSHDTINITWSPPRSINGELDHYMLSRETVPFSKDLITERDYCEKPMRKEIIPDNEEIKKHFIPEPRYPTDQPIKLPDCYELPDEYENIFLYDRNYNFSHHRRYKLCDKNSQSKYGFDDCGVFFYETETENKTIPISKRSSDVIQTKSRKRTNLNFPKSEPFQVYHIEPDRLFYTIKNLDHFTLYVFYMEACNSMADFNNLCSAVLYSFTRTLPKPNADDITDVQPPIVRGRDVEIIWQPPKNPNAQILSYKIQYYKESEHAQPVDYCMTHEKFMRKRRHVLKNLIPGLYYLKLQAVSVAGPGNFTKTYEFEVQSEFESQNVFWIGFTISTILVMAFMALWVYFRYKRKRATQVFVSINPDYSSIYVEDEWEEDRNNIQMIREIGQGTFGMVHYGMIKSKNLPCAIKTVHETASLETRSNFLTEATVMKAFSNAHHVVKLLGVVSKGQPPLVIMEIMERGDLKQYLRTLRDSSQNFTCNEIYRMSIEIADGMAFLAAKKYVHRDLAARNCMVGHDRTVKVGDFGMTRDIYETDYYRKGTRGLLPVRWMAPESLGDGVFSTDSDVWSYGIVLWEIATLAEQPYQGLSNEQVLQFVVAKGRLERPPECPDLLYEIMHACWYWKPYDRPTFGEIVEKLQDHVGQDFKLVSYYHSKEGQDFRMIAGGKDKTYNQPALGTGEDSHQFYDEENQSDDDETSLYTGSRRSNSFLPISSLSLKSSRLTDGFK